MSKNIGIFREKKEIIYNEILRKYSDINNSITNRTISNK